MHLKRMICVGAAALGVTASTAVASASAKVTEAGSSLVFPLAEQWASHYTSDNVVTAAGGSSTGIADIQHNSIDIGASDAPMTPTQYTGDTSGTPIEIPWALSATGIGYNIPGIKHGLQLNASVLAGIFTGKITSWSDKSITKLNPKYKKQLAKAGKITPVYRSDGSGDSYAFQHFLTVAAGSAWPYSYSTAWGGSTGVGENGNAGVAGEVHSNTGTIGYISAAYLIQQNISAAAVENAAGNFEVPNPANISNAAASNSTIDAQGPNFTGVSIVNPAKKYKIAYPISTYTYAMVNKNNSNINAVQAFINWVISPTGGQRLGANLDFVQLPSGIRSQVSSLVNGL
jgi:phosphate transport system substrate-binding protein